MNGFLCVLKPPGMTSSDVVVRVRRKLGRGAKVGHAGTLDPEASGVLPLMIGRAARLFDYLVEKEKTYVAQLKPGYATDTQDAHGAIVSGGGARATRAQLEAVLPRFIGDIAQIPPMYSALKRDGQKLCDLARQGIDVKVEPRPTQVYAIDVLHENEDGSFILQIRCGRGTYIRTLCNDIGEALGTKAHMGVLLRTQTGMFTLDEAHTIEEIDAAEDFARNAGFSQVCLASDLVGIFEKYGFSSAGETKNGETLFVHALPAPENAKAVSPIRSMLPLMAGLLALIGAWMVVGRWIFPG